MQIFDFHLPASYPDIKTALLGFRTLHWHVIDAQTDGLTTLVIEMDPATGKAVFRVSALQCSQWFRNSATPATQPLRSAGSCSYHAT